MRTRPPIVIHSSLLRLDAGAGEIQCPLKGLMAIQRCESLQVETATVGRPCLCATRMGYCGGVTASHQGRQLAPGGRAARSDDDADSRLARKVMRHVLPDDED